MIADTLNEQRILELASQMKDDYESFIRTLESDLGMESDSKKGSAFLEVGEVLSDNSYFSLALKSYLNALNYYSRVSDSLGETSCLNSIGVIYGKQHQYQEAIKYFEKALVIDKNMGYSRYESHCYQNIGQAYTGLGQYQEAIKYYENALSIAKDITGDKKDQSACYRSIGVVYEYLGQYQKALEYLEKALSIADYSILSKCLNDIGAIYINLGQYQDAIYNLDQALYTDAVITHDKRNHLSEYYNIGTAYYKLGQYQKALEYLEKALSIAKDITGDKGAESQCYENIGLAYTGLGQYQKALEYLEKALSIAKDITGDKGESTYYNSIGTAYYKLGQYQEAIKYYENALSIAKDITGDKSVLSQSTYYGNLGVCYKALQDLEKAYDNFKKSIELSEGMSQMLVEDEFKIEFGSTVSKAYLDIVQVCMRLERKDKEIEAFDYVERSKSRALIELISTSTRILPTAPMTDRLKELLESENDHISRLRQIQTRSHRIDEKVRVEPGETERLRKELENIYDEMSKYDKQYVSLRKPKKPISLVEIQARLTSIGRNAAMVEFFVTQEETLIFIITQKDLHVEKAQLTRDKLIEYLDIYKREVLEYPELGDIGDFFIQELSRYLMEPISKYLMNTGLVYFIPHDLLHYIPLHSLLLNGEPIIKHHSIAYTTSASLMSYFRPGKRQLDTSASFGVVLNDDEQLFGEEAERISRVLNGEHFPNATKKIVLSNLNNKDILHFSCHGYFKDGNPLSSCIIFHGDKNGKGRNFQYDELTAREILNPQNRMNADLVTLSACETGLSEVKRGDELIGLTRSLLYAGAASVVVSLWPVNAHSTIELMEEFYRLLKYGKDKNGRPLDKATALQQATIKIMTNPKYSHPYFWAPFIIIGNWE